MKRFEGNPLGMGIGISPDLQDPSTLFQMESTSKGFKTSSMTTAEMNAIPSPIKGLEVFNITTNTKWFYNGTIWVDMGGGAAYSSNNGITQTGNNFALGGASPLLADTTIAVGAFSLGIGVLSASANGVVIGGGSLDASAVMQINSTNKGVLISRMTTVQRLAIALPADGLIVFDTDLEVLCWYDATAPVWRITASQSYVNNAVLGVMRIVGAIDASTNPNYPAALKGDAYYISVDGKVGGALGVDVHIGDYIFAIADNAGGTQAAVGTDWIILETNAGQATTSTLGLVALATNGELLAKTDTLKAATAAALLGFVSLNYETDCSTNPNYPAAKKGDTIRVTVAGRIGGINGKIVRTDDLVICSTTNAGGDEAAVGSNWIAIQRSSFRGTLAAAPLIGLAGDFYTDSASGVNYFYDPVNITWNTQGIIHLTAAQRVVYPASTGLLVYQTDGVDSGLWYYNGSIWIEVAKVLTVENFYGATDAITFTASVNGAGSQILTADSVTAANQGGVTLYTRMRVGASLGATAAGRVVLYQAGFNRLSANNRFYYEWESRNTVAINPATDSAINWIGLFLAASTAAMTAQVTSNNTPADGIYFRPAFTTDAAPTTYKFVVRVGGIEVLVKDTGIAQTNATDFIKAAFLWDGFSNSITFFFSNEVANYQFTVPTFFVTYPTLSALVCIWGWRVSRPAVAAAGVVQIQEVSVIRRYVFPVSFNKNEFI